MTEASKVHEYKIVALASLAPYERNARTHDDVQIAQLRRSIREFGFTNPLLIDEHNGIIAGHGRFTAAGLEGMTEVPAIVIAGLSAAQKAALVIADNKLALNAGWDDALLLAEITSLPVELSGVTGFNDAEVAQLMASIENIGQVDARAEWGGMPAYTSGDEEGYQLIVMHFRNEADVAAFAALVDQKVTKQTKFLWYPAKEREVNVDKRYVEAQP